MQITETEISIPLKIHNANGMSFSNTIEVFVYICGLFIVFLITSVYCLFFLFQSMIITSFILAFAISFILASLLLALMLPVFIRGLQTGPWQLRINQEGIFYSYILSIFIRWDEITAFVPFTLGGTQKLGIVVEDEMAIFARFLETHSIKGWERTYYHLLFKLNTWLIYSCYHSPSSISLSQPPLPISIDALMAMIQERFAIELHENYSTIWC